MLGPTTWAVEKRGSSTVKFAAADADDTVSAVEDNGGSVLMPAADVPDVDRIAWMADPYGAEFAVLKPNPRQSQQCPIIGALSSS
ncbi:hypothetical protein [Streptomyces yerevanensis]|uniref:hypothetical protein n=1 Tax=Streptomyces yerevanensis TaxID=66378 RepID=UPI000527CE85